MLFQKNYKKSIIFSFLLGPYLLWLLIFKDFFLGHISLYKDTYANFCMFKYFYNNLFNGIIPLWEPFVYLGRPHIHSISSGALNPLALSVFSLHFIGLDYFQLYAIYLFLYFLVGLIGFFVLSRQILKNDTFSLIAAWLLMFSGMGGMLFNQINIVMLFVPAVWFFAFFFRFFEFFSKRDFWGIVCSLMLIAVSYYPFYFITAFLSFFVVFSVFFSKVLISKTKDFWSFVRNNLLIFIVGLLFISSSFLPLIAGQFLNRSGEIVSPSRHSCKSDNLDKCPSGLEMSFEESAFFGAPLEKRVSLDRVFSNLDKIFYGDECVFYVPLICYLFIFCSLLTFFDRLRAVILLSVSLIFFISLGHAFLFYRFLFDHIFYFKYFRNLFFYTAFILPGIILFAVAQFKSLVEQSINKNVSLCGVLIGCAFLCGVFQFQGSITALSYVSLFLFLILFCLIKFYPKFESKFLLLILALIVLEPMYVLTSYKQNMASNDNEYSRSHQMVSFQYERPLELKFDRRVLESSFANNFSTYALLYNASLSDAAAGLLLQKDFDFFQKYTGKILVNPQNLTNMDKKFVIYDKRDHSSFFPLKDSNEFRVLHFDVNSLTLETNFKEKEFLVYNDTYSIFWNVLINSKKADLYLVNNAFKGVSLPAGQNIVEFRYSPPGGQWVYIYVLSIMFLAFLILGKMWWKDA